MDQLLPLLFLVSQVYDLVHVLVFHAHPLNVVQIDHQLLLPPQVV